MIKKHEYLKSLVHPLVLSCEQLLDEKEWLMNRRLNRENYGELMERLKVGLTLLENDK